ncbi:NitT/TauT family transport system ATP-binding protein [Pigmentiphaga kullae]|uniref:NitT/TauT family transport system ATP-binding protein n=1 Tax=Pigmentiphaga kullae TaxID=151784 RepID=A0A4Q7N9M5_9BURK|nr:NitT/TauT family transport system ATP-binding protein [Pigmentiphaga kullae]
MLEVKRVTKTFRRGKHVVNALSAVDLAVRKGEFLTILGPSGCGKTTLLHMLGGFEFPTEGSVEIEGRPITGPGRDRGMVFQEAMLFPWRTVRANVAWPLLVAGTPRRQAHARADELLARVGLARFGNAYPGELSGGMRQRAALARTLAMEPSVLLMDEPFGALDAQTREVMQEELTRLWQASGLTVVFITHDINEAIFLGDRVVVMGASPGRVVEDRAIELERPRSSETKSDPRILEYRSHLWDVLRRESARSAPAMAEAGR